MFARKDVLHILKTNKMMKKLLSANLIGQCITLSGLALHCQDVTISQGLRIEINIQEDERKCGCSLFKLLNVWKLCGKSMKGCKMYQVVSKLKALKKSLNQ